MAGGSRGSRRRLILLAIAVALGAWAFGAAIVGWSAYRHAQEGTRRLEALEESLSEAELLRGGGVKQLEAALREFELAHEASRSPFLMPLRPLPVFGRQVQSFDSQSGATVAVLEAGITGLGRIDRDVPEGSGIPPSERSAVLRTVRDVAGELHVALADADLGPSDGLVPPLARARERLSVELEAMRKGVARAEAASGGLAALFAGDGRYLVLISNNAEMRAGFGTILRVGELVVDDGSIRLEDLRSAGAPLDMPVDADADLTANWEWLEPAQRFQNLGVTPRFDVVAPAAARIWAANGGASVDGVLALDVAAIRAVLAATGPVSVDGREISADNVEEEIFVRQYDEPDQQEERLGELARATIEALDGGDWELATLADELRQAAAGRHMLAWSTRPSQQRAWEAAGIAGEVGDDSLLVSVLNLGGNKLDQFLEVRSSIGVEDLEDDWLVTVNLRLRNATPEAGLAREIAGPFEGTSFAPGEYAGVVTANVPGSATDVGMEGGDLLIVNGEDGVTRVIGSWVQILPGETQALQIQFRLPGEVRQLVVEPSARIPPVQWRAGRDLWADDERRTLRW
jgi:Protein of unknown function (DUF4012)